MPDTSFEEEYARAKAKTAPAPSGADESNVFLEAPSYRPPAPPAPPQQPYKGQILPMSVDESGTMSFDPNAGLLGMLKKPFDYTYDVRTGKIPADVRNPAYVGGAFDAAMTYAPGAAVARAGRGGVQAASTGALDEAAEAGFRNYRQSGQMYPGDEYRSLLQNTQDQLRQAGFHNLAESAPVPHGVLEREAARVRNAPFVTSQDLDALRTQLRGQGLRGPNVPANMQAREALFGYIDQNLPPDSGRSVRDAVANYRQARHSDVITGKDEATSLKNMAKARGPDLSAEQTRTNIANLLTSKNALKGFSDTERSVMRGAVEGTPNLDRAQRIGNALSLKNAAAGGGAAGALASIPSLLMSTPSATGMGIGGALAATAAAGGAAARSYANRGARRLSDEADNFIRAQAPLSREQFVTAPANVVGSPYSVMRNPAIADAVTARLREGKPQRDLPQQYRVLPDGTVEELL